MKTKLTNESWVWIIIQNPEKNEQILCQNYVEKNIKFIPTFLDKTHALMCMNFFNKQDNNKYEPQAIIYEELLSHAKSNGFQVFFLNEKGTVQDMVIPE